MSYTCNNCGHTWESRKKVGTPSYCPACNSQKIKTAFLNIDGPLEHLKDLQPLEVYVNGDKLESYTEKKNKLESQFSPGGPTIVTHTLNPVEVTEGDEIRIEPAIDGKAVYATLFLERDSPFEDQLIGQGFEFTIPYKRKGRFRGQEMRLFYEGRVGEKENDGQKVLREAHFYVYVEKQSFSWNEKLLRSLDNILAKIDEVLGTENLSFQDSEEKGQES